MTMTMAEADAKPSMGKRESILLAAEQTFLARGFKGASMDAIAEAAGVARRTLYNQFASKEEIFEAVVRNAWANITITDEAAWNTMDDPRQGLTRFATEIVEFWARPGSVALLRMVLAESLRSSELLREFVQSGKGPAFEATVAYLRRLSRTGRLEVPDAKLAANQFLGLLNEPLLWQKLLLIEESSTAAYRRRVVESAVGMFLAHYDPRG